MAEPITRNAYAILGVLPDTEHGAIVAAYRALARRYHPDIAGESATERMILVNAAFDRLRTPERRAAYDLELEDTRIPLPGRRTRGPAAAAPSPPAPTGRPAAAPRTAAGTDRAPTSANWRRDEDGTGGAGPPPGRPSGSVLGFGRHIGWSIGEIARVDPGYLVWLQERREGRPYGAEIDRILRATGHRGDGPAPPDSGGRRRR